MALGLVGDVLARLRRLHPPGSDAHEHLNQEIMRLFKVIEKSAGKATMLQAAAAWQEVEHQGQAQRQAQAQAQAARPVRDFAAEAAAAEEGAAARRLRATAAAHAASREWRSFCAAPADEACARELSAFYRAEEVP